MAFPGLGGLLGGSSMLKKAKKKVPFADIDLTLSPDKIKKSPTNRMRDIGHMHLCVMGLCNECLYRYISSACSARGREV